MAGKALHVLECSVRSQGPLKILGKASFSHPFVLITASGLQGEQPLVDRTM
jgi:hypothetical protein